MKNKVILFLQILLLIYSLGPICGKFSANYPILSVPFLFCYAISLGLLGVYAIGWQQIIKRLPLTTAFANKAVTVVWGIIWGALFFQEAITLGKIIGAALVIAGVALFALADGEDEHG